MIRKYFPKITILSFTLVLSIFFTSLFEKQPVFTDSIASPKDISISSNTGYYKFSSVNTPERSVEDFDVLTHMVPCTDKVIKPIWRL